jgi:hypothetical protein
MTGEEGAGTSATPVLSLKSPLFSLTRSVRTMAVGNLFRRLVEAK